VEHVPTGTSPTGTAAVDDAAAAAAACASWPQGRYCPEGSNSSITCPPGSYQQLEQQAVCLPCPENFFCPGNGTVSATACPTGRLAPAGSAACGDCDYDRFYLPPGSSACRNRTILACDLATQYEVATPLNRSQEFVCKPLTPCYTVRLPAESPVEGSPAGVELFAPLQEYVMRYNTR